MNRKTFFVILVGFFLSLNRKFSSIFKKEKKRDESSLKTNEKLLG